MPFNERARFDTSQIDDQRARRLRGGGLALGAGGGLVALILLFLSSLGGSSNGLELGEFESLPSNQGPRTADGVSSSLVTDCATGADANERDDCRNVAEISCVQAWWAQDFAGRGLDYRYARTQLFAEQTRTGCGAANAANGPFYCPDQQIYIDLGFFADLRTTFGASGGPFPQAYIIAHEYGHRVQELLGVLGEIGRSRAGAESAAARSEFQADCLARVWANHAEEAGFITAVTHSDVRDALDPAGAVADDRIQEQQGEVNPESWTHGSSERRQERFLTRLSDGSIEACDTFRTELG